MSCAQNKTRQDKTSSQRVKSRAPPHTHIHRQTDTCWVVVLPFITRHEIVVKGLNRYEVNAHTHTHTTHTHKDADSVLMCWITHLSSHTQPSSLHAPRTPRERGVSTSSPAPRRPPPLPEPAPAPRPDWGPDVDRLRPAGRDVGMDRDLEVGVGGFRAPPDSVPRPRPARADVLRPLVAETERPLDAVPRPRDLDTGKRDFIWSYRDKIHQTMPSS